MNPGIVGKTSETESVGSYRKMRSAFSYPSEPLDKLALLRVHESKRANGSQRI